MVCSLEINKRARKHDFSKFLEGFVTIDKTWMNQKTKEQSKKGLSRTQKISCQKNRPVLQFSGTSELVLYESFLKIHCIRFLLFYVST